MAISERLRFQTMAALLLRCYKSSIIHLTEYGIPSSRSIIIPTPWPIMAMILLMMNMGSSKRSLFPWTVPPLQKWRLRNSPQLPIMVNITLLSNSIPMNMPLLIEAMEMMAMSKPLPFQPMGKP